MTRATYSALARAFANSRPIVAKRSTRAQRDAYEVWRQTRLSVMVVLGQANPNFDPERFIRATEQNS